METGMAGRHRPGKHTSERQAGERQEREQKELGAEIRRSQETQKLPTIQRRAK